MPRRSHYITVREQAEIARSVAPAGTGAQSSVSEEIFVGYGQKIVITTNAPDAGEITSIDWGSDTDVGVRVARLTSAALADLEIWEINNPTPGTRIITVNYDATQTVGFGIYIFSGAGPLSDVVTGTTTAATTHSLTVPNVDPEDYVLKLTASSGNIVPAGDLFELYNNTGTGGQYESHSKDGADGVVGEMLHTSGSTRDTSAIAVRVPYIYGITEITTVFPYARFTKRRFNFFLTQ